MIAFDKDRMRSAVSTMRSFHNLFQANSYKKALGW
jgi:hypothetical protein